MYGEYRKIEHTNFQPRGISAASAIAELTEAAQRIQRMSFRKVVLCEDCIIKKAVPHKDGIVWRCPHRTGDVKMEGFCESGVRADGDLGRMERN